MGPWPSLVRSRWTPRSHCGGTGTRGGNGLPVLSSSGIFVPRVMLMRRDLPSTLLHDLGIDSSEVFRSEPESRTCQVGNVETSSWLSNVIEQVAGAPRRSSALQRLLSEFALPQGTEGLEDASISASPPEGWLRCNFCALNGENIQR
jgi:hypothetical protein